MKIAWLDDIIRDKDTRHVVARDLFKAAAFAGALAWGATMAYLKFRGDKDLTAEPMYALLAYSGGLQYIKARQIAAAGVPPTGAAEPPPGEGSPAYQLP
jgi:hypothetical protein